MLLLSLLLIPFICIFITASLSYENTSNLNIKYCKIIALIASVVNLISFIIFILFNFSDNQFQLVQEYHKIHNFDFYLGIDGISIESILLGVIALMCFTSILCLIIVYIATSNIPEIINSESLELNPTTKATHLEKEVEKDNPHLDIVWTDLEGSYLKFIFDQNNANGVKVISMLARPNTRVETQLINGIQHVGIRHHQDTRTSLSSDLLKRSFNRNFLFQNRVSVTSGGEPLVFDGISVILRKFN